MVPYNFVILSNQFFDHTLKTNKWQVAIRLAGLGQNVIFVDPPTRFKGIKKIWVKFFHRGSEESGIDNLFIYTPLDLFNFWLFSSFNTWVHSTRIKSLLSKLESRKTVFWIYHFDYPDLEVFLSKFKYDLLIYDVVDEYSAFPEYKSGKKVNTGVISAVQRFDEFLKTKIDQGGLSGSDWVSKRENWLARVSDLIFATAPALVLKFQNILKTQGGDTTKVNFVPNAGDYLKFKDSKKFKDQIPNGLTEIPRPRIVYYGAIDSYKVDLDLIEKCALSYRNFSFVLIGPEKVSDPDLNLKALKKLENVFFFGPKKYETLPYYLAGADVFIIPYNLNDYTIGGCYPVKFHEVLSAGLPTVVTNMPVYKTFSEVCYIARDKEDFVRLIKVALEEDSEEKVKARQEVAKENSWENKVEKQISLINAVFLSKEK